MKRWQETWLRQLDARQVFGWTMPVLAMAGALLVGSLIVLVAGANPLTAYEALFRGAVGNKGLLATTLVKSVPLMLAGLAIVVSFRASIWNIGGEGQIYLGALFAVWAGVNLDLPAWLHVLVALSFGVVGGMFWGAIPGYLKATRGFNEVVVTIFMNFIAIGYVSYLVHGPMRESGWNFQTPAVADSARLPVVWPGTHLHAGILVALAAALIVYVILFYTTLGYRIRMVGYNPEAARYAGVPVMRITVITLALSGAFAGLAGAVEILGVQYRLLDGFSPGWGFDAIAVALVGQLHPIGILPAALFFGALRTGANSMQTATGLPTVVVFAIQGLAVLFVMVGTALQRYHLRRVVPQETRADVRDATATVRVG